MHAFLMNAKMYVKSKVLLEHPVVHLSKASTIAVLFLYSPRCGFSVEK